MTGDTRIPHNISSPYIIPKNPLYPSRHHTLTQIPGIHLWPIPHTYPPHNISSPHPMTPPPFPSMTYHFIHSHRSRRYIYAAPLHLPPLYDLLLFTHPPPPTLWHSTIHISSILPISYPPHIISSYHVLFNDTTPPTYYSKKFPHMYFLIVLYTIYQPTMYTYIHQSSYTSHHTDVLTAISPHNIPPISYPLMTFPALSLLSMTPPSPSSSYPPLWHSLHPHPITSSSHILPLLYMTQIPPIHLLKKILSYVSSEQPSPSSGCPQLPAVSTDIGIQDGCTGSPPHIISSPSMTYLPSSPHLWHIISSLSPPHIHYSEKSPHMYFPPSIQYINQLITHTYNSHPILHIYLMLSTDIPPPSHLWHKSPHMYFPKSPSHIIHGKLPPIIFWKKSPICIF